MINLHVLPPPHGITKKFDDMVCCAFTQTVVNFLKSMEPFKDDFNIMHYGHEDSDTTFVDEHITVVTNDDYKKAGYFDYDWKKEAYKFHPEDAVYSAFYNNAKVEIEKRVKRNDIILTFGGFHFELCRDLQNTKAIICDPSIGHRHAYTDYRVYVSYPHMHAMYGYRHAKQVLYNQIHEHADNMKKDNDRYTIVKDGKTLINYEEVVGDIINKASASLWYRSNEEALDVPRFQDAVIPIPVDEEDFTYLDKEDKEDFFLFMGRLNYSKGFEIAVEAAREYGKRLVLAGQNNPEWALGYKLPEFVDYLGGSVGVDERRELQSKAKIAFVTTLLNEPGPTIIPELGLSGTPVIGTDWGGLIDCLIPYVNGFRCRHDFGYFCWAVENIGLINSETCRSFAKQRNSLDIVGKMYDEYFKRISLNAQLGHKQSFKPNDRIDENFWHNNKPENGLELANLQSYFSRESPQLDTGEED